MDPFVQSCSGLPPTPHMANLHALLESMNNVRVTKETGAVVMLIQRVVENLLEGLIPQPNQGPSESESLARYRDANLLALKAISDNRAYGQTWTNNRVTSALVDAREEIKYNLDAFDTLIRNGLVNLCEYDKHLALAMSNGKLRVFFRFHLGKIYYRILQA